MIRTEVHTASRRASTPTEARSSRRFTNGTGESHPEVVWPLLVQDVSANGVESEQTVGFVVAEISNC